jgi:hypothetical protein
MVVGEDPRENEAHGDPGGVDPLPPQMVAVAVRGLDDSPREDLEEGEPGLLPELVPKANDLVARGRGGRLGHGDLLGVVTGRPVSIAKLPTEQAASLPHEAARLKF